MADSFVAMGRALYTWLYNSLVSNGSGVFVELLFSLLRLVVLLLPSYLDFSLFPYYLCLCMFFFFHQSFRMIPIHSPIQSFSGIFSLVWKEDFLIYFLVSLLFQRRFVR